MGPVYFNLKMRLVGTHYPVDFLCLAFELRSRSRAEAAPVSGLRQRSFSRGDVSPAHSRGKMKAAPRMGSAFLVSTPKGMLQGRLAVPGVQSLESVCFTSEHLRYDRS